MNPYRSRLPLPRVVAGMAIGLGVAVVLAILIGQGDFVNLGRVAFGLSLLLFVLFFLEHTWKLALLLCFVDFWHIGLGFRMSSLEMTLFIGGVVFSVTWWRKSRISRPETLERWSFTFLNTVTLAWLIYVLCHTIFNIYAPYRPYEYAFNNLVKMSVAWAGPFLLTFYFSNRPAGIVVRPNFPIRVGQLLLLGLIVNVSFAVYHVFAGDFEFARVPDALEAESTEIQIPLLNLTENAYALRNLSPMAMLVGGTFLASKWMRSQSVGTRRLFQTVCFLSIPGAVLSGGRATLVFVLLMAVTLLVVRRRVATLMTLLVVAIVTVAAANVFRSAIEHSPDMVKRSVNWALVHKFESAQGSIESSTVWRVELIQQALAEWRSDARVFWFGRATYSYGTQDLIATMLRGGDGIMESSLRRGATHNLVTDLLVVFGLSGLLIYFLLQFALLFFLFQIFRSSDANELTRSLGLALLIYVGFSFSFALIGGGTYPVGAAWLYVILITYVRSCATERPPVLTDTRRVRPVLHGRTLPV